MNAKEYFNALNENQIATIADFMSKNWSKFVNMNPRLSKEEAGEIGEFIATCQQPQLATEPTIETVTVKLREAIQEAEAFGLVRYQDPKTNKVTVVTGAVATLTGVLLVKE